MATNIIDLVTAIDAQLAAGAVGVPVGDVAVASERAGRLIRNLSRSGLDPLPGGPRERSAGALATAAVNLGLLWPTDPGRCAALVGALADAVGKLDHELTRSDRWHTAISLSSVITGSAAVLRDSGPFRHLPELGVADRCAISLLRHAAADPPDPDRIHGVTRPIPAGASREEPGEQIYESLSIILDHLNRHHRPELTGRQIIATTRTGCAISSLPCVAGEHAAHEWRSVLALIAHIYDPHPSQPDPILTSAATISRIAREMCRTDWGRLDPNVETRLLAAAGLLPRVAAALAHELRTRQRPLILIPGQRPISEARVAEWLARTSVLATRGDLEPVVRLLDGLVHHQPSHEPKNRDTGGTWEPVAASVVPSL